MQENHLAAGELSVPEGREGGHRGDPQQTGPGSPAAPYTCCIFAYRQGMLDLTGKMDREMEKQYKYLAFK